MATAHPHQRFPGPSLTLRASHTLFPFTLTAVSLGRDSHNPTVHTRKQAPREVDTELKVIQQAGGRAGI